MLVGWLTSLAIAWLFLVAIDGLGILQAHPHSSFFVEPPPSRSKAVWLGDAALMLGRLSLVTLFWAALFAPIVRIAEQEGEKPVVFWLLAGFGAALPIALVFATARETGVSDPQPLRIFLLVSIYACLPFMIGAHVARRFRHPASWQ